MDYKPFLIVTIISAVFLLIAGLYRPLRVRMTREHKHPFKPLAFYPYFIGAIGVILTTPAVINLALLNNPGPIWSIMYMISGVLTGLLAGGLYVLGYTGKAPYKLEALLILPLLAADICLAFAYAANL